MTSERRIFRTAARCVVLFLVCAFVLGCGEKLNRVSGKVTFKGQPIPAGKIYFQPDASKGNKGPSGYADIKDGSYDTGAPGGQGVKGGPTLVIIEGNDPSSTDKKDTSGEVTSKSLFPRYETTAEMPNSSGVKDFEVPADAATRQPKKGPAVVVP